MRIFYKHPSITNDLTLLKVGWPFRWICNKTGTKEPLENCHRKCKEKGSNHWGGEFLLEISNLVISQGPLGWMIKDLR